MNYIATADAAKKWHLSQRRVVALCSGGRIPGAEKIGSTWLIPDSSEKPADARIKSGAYRKQKQTGKEGGHE